MTAVLALLAIAIVAAAIWWWSKRRFVGPNLRRIAELWDVAVGRLETDEQLRTRILRRMSALHFAATTEDIRFLFADGAGVDPVSVRVASGAPGEVVISVPLWTRQRKIEAGRRAVEHAMPCGTAVRVERQWPNMQRVTL